MLFTKKTVLSQIQQILNDQERLIKRSQLKRSDYKIFGQENTPQDTKVEEEQNLDAHLSNYNTHIYDDDDFYQEMLKELIESRMVETGKCLCFW